MLSPSTPFWGIPCGVPRFWRLRVAKDFSKPEYYIGQTVIHVVKRGDKTSEFLVDIRGLSWTGFDWQYFIEVPSCHPDANPPWEETAWVDAKELKLQ
ncbi:MULTISPECIES: hypothetical protein [unclassified Tolypothrix]|uniref:hypothetical protein n=1 Tax=unclassified Tolypothrix TaxID=2649714 RepID=UPI0005EAA90E|nr:MULTISPECIES: hypothetical protein [unclassified Tolypothrix]BAY90789.1 hypothetical protein NIES3275_28060 [Microchaete diplosiphon NIES-3275]EKF04364.1 hypothetical protein FDUTEX481_02043 [Tolypothrix sp. PCC 7601]MBE9081011.1 hypothetical protein [Tolypothrix sp. LEGE 11397]UYD24922.1 hypothetical protein HGR01_26425 [Tolypothrix sp. PCC 7712]UYD32845.1 hypothetical protein HG267_28210 [Tolypothrix sp. PCC 7601]